MVEWYTCTTERSVCADATYGWMIYLRNWEECLCRCNIWLNDILAQLRAVFVQMQHMVEWYTCATERSVCADAMYGWMRYLHNWEECLCRCNVCSKKCWCWLWLNTDIFDFHIIQVFYSLVSEQMWMSKWRMIIAFIWLWTALKKWPGFNINHLPPSGTKVKERVDLYF
jgi:hypothetical protein